MGIDKTDGVSSVAKALGIEKEIEQVRQTPTFYTLSQAAEKLGLSNDGIKNLVRLGKLNEFRDGGNINYKADAVRALMTHEDATRDIKEEEDTAERAESPKTDTLGAKMDARYEYVYRLRQLADAIESKPFVPNEVVPLQMQLLECGYEMEKAAWELAEPEERFVRIGVVTTPPSKATTNAVDAPTNVRFRLAKERMSHDEC